MRGRFGVLAFAGSFLLLAGCARMGLNPLPENSEPGGMDHGLDPFPEAMNPEEDSEIGADPFPAALNPGESNDTGLDPFPEPAAADGKKKDGIGLDPFPKMAKGKGFPGLGLNPFPVDKNRRERRAAKAVTAGSSKTVTTDTPASEEYPDEPPVVLPGAPERNEDSGVPRPAKRRKSYKDD